MYNYPILLVLLILVWMYQSSSLHTHQDVEDGIHSNYTSSSDAFMDESEQLLDVIDDVMPIQSSRSLAESCNTCPQLCDYFSKETVSCTCFRGFRLVPSPTFCTDINECVEQQELCKPGGRCINTAGSYVCRCPAGFRTSVAGRCIDIDECASSKVACSQICSNLPGTYACSCYRGYKLRPDSNVCEDLNECELRVAGCSHICSNTEGSFLCRCPANLHLAEDGKTCISNSKRLRKSAVNSKQDSRTLKDIRNKCQFQCLHGGTCKHGGCYCPSGLTGSVCQHDIDECLLLPADLKCEYRCQNTFGSFQCECKPGWTLGADRHSCLPTDCIPPCTNGGTCVNGVCSCPKGRTGRSCSLDEDECMSSPCEHKCHNTIGSYVCLCQSNWRLAGDGRSCVEPPCVPHCRNGGVCRSGRCVCAPGFKGRLCQIDINECVSEAPPCEHICINSFGSFQCLCPPGLRLTANRISCEPDPQSNDEAVEHMDVIIEIVIEDNHSRLTHHTMGTKRVRIPGITSTQSNVIYQLIRPTSTSEDNIKTSSHNSNLVVDSGNMVDTPILPSHVDTNILLSTSVPYETLIEFIDVQPSSMDFDLSSHVITTPLSDPHNQSDSFENASNIYPSFSMDFVHNLSQHILSESGNVQFKEEANEVLEHEDAEIGSIDEDTTEETIESNKYFNLISPTDNFQLLQEIANSLFPSIYVTHKSDNVESTVVSSSLSELQTSLFESIETIHVASTSQLETVSYFTATTQSFNVPGMESNKQNRKHKKKKKKSKQRKVSKIKTDFQILNQILQTYDLHATNQSKIRLYETVDLDASRSIKPSVSTSAPISSDTLPVLQALPSNRKEIDCYYDKKRYKSRSSFYRDEKNCTKCVCKDGELRCAPRLCPPTHCEIPLSSDCCDYCPGDCVVDQQVYLPGEEFSPYLDPCRECKCEAGRAICHDIVCPVLACKEQYRVELAGECCPVCIPPEPGCFFNGKFFYTGQLWVHRQGGCQACLCKDKGEVQCNPVVCVVGCQHPLFIPGECCPICEGCQHHGNQYEHGQTFSHPSDNCSTCQCHHGNITCYEKPCKFNCSSPFKPPGKCCPECVDCAYQEEYIRNGSNHTFTTENGTCYECSCQAGEVTCKATDCLPGCVTHAGQHVVSGAQVTLNSDPCTKCRCIAGHIECRAEPCHTLCTNGVLLPGACCLDCSHCDYKDQLYGDLQVFREPDDSCVSCLCAKGNVLCENSCEASEDDSSYDEEGASPSR